jgi:osmotically-inducible protein OsmY
MWRRAAPVDHDEPAAYLNEHVKDALLHDPDVGELDVQVAVDGMRVVISGHVSTVERQEAISRVLAELLPDHDVRNDTTVTVYPELEVPS